jgi:hypothetical protein
MYYTAEARARVSAAVAESNRRRGEQDPEIRKARRAFTQHRSNAAQRRVSFELTFKEWWQIWKSSGKWALRGTHRGCYVMSRYGDVGPYASWNVFINLAEENFAAGHRGRKRTPAQNAARREFMKGNTNGAGNARVSDAELLAALRRTPNTRQALLSVGLSTGRGQYARANKLLCTGPPN